MKKRIKLDIQPLPDLWQFCKKTFSPFEEGAFRTDLFHLFFASFGLVAAPVLFFHTLIMSESRVLFANPALTRVQSWISLGLSMMESLRIALYSCLMFVATPLYLFRFLTRSLITLAVGWGCSREEIIHRSLQNGDLTTLRYFPRRWLGEDLYPTHIDRSQAQAALLSAIHNKQTPFFCWLFREVAEDGMHLSKKLWRAVCQNDSAPCAHAFFSYYERFQRSTLQSVIVLDLLCPALEVGAADVARAILDQYPADENHGQVRFASQKIAIDYCFYARHIVAFASESGSIEIFDIITNMGFTITPAHRDRLLRATCEKGSVDCFMTLQQRYNVSVHDCDPSLLFNACASKSVDMFKMLVDKFALDPSVIESPRVAISRGCSLGLKVRATGLAVAIFKGSMPMVRYLTQVLDVDTQQVFELLHSPIHEGLSFNALHTVCRCSIVNPVMVQYYLDLGFDAQEYDALGSTPFALLLSNHGMDSDAIIPALLSKSPDLSKLIVDFNNPTVLTNGLLLLIKRCGDLSIGGGVMKRHILQARDDTLVKSFRLIIQDSVAFNLQNPEPQRALPIHSSVENEFRHFLCLFPWLFDVFRQVVLDIRPGFIDKYDEFILQHGHEPLFKNSKTNTWACLFNRSIGLKSPEHFQREMIQGYTGLSKL